MRRILTISLAAALFAVALPSAAQASMEFYCIGDHSLCPAGETHLPATAGSISNVLEDAEVSADGAEVFVGAGDYTVCSTLSVNAASSHVRLIGAGADQTRFLACDTTTTLLSFKLNSLDSVVSGVSFVSTAMLSGSNPLVAIEGGTLRGVKLSMSGPANSSRPGVRLTKGAIEDSTIANSDGYGVVVNSNAVTSKISDSAVSARCVAIDAFGDATITRVRVGQYGICGFKGISNHAGAHAVISDSLVDLGAGVYGAQGVSTEGDGSAPSLVNADRLTIVGTGPSQVGLQVGQGGSGSSMTGATITDSIIHVTATSSLDLGCYRTNGPAQLNAIRVAYNSTKVNMQNAPAPNACTLTPSDSDYFTEGQPIGFVDAAAGDYHLRHDSVLLNAGATSVPAGSLDLDRNPRLLRDPHVSQVDPTRVDLGAYEYQANAPALSLSVPATAQPGATVAMSAEASDTDPGESAQLSAISWSFGDSTQASGGAVSHVYANPGTYPVSVSVTDPAGRSAVASASIVVRDTIRPTIKITKKPKKSSAARKAQIKFKASERTTFRCKLDKAKKWSKCKSPWKKTVKRGKHKLQIRATDAAGNVSKTATVKWNVKKKR